MDKFEELKMYKVLLDQEIITQEEFDTKKKELLDDTAIQNIESKSSSSEQNTATNSFTSDSSVKLSAKATAVLSYISIIAWLIVYVIGDKEGAKFHLNQSLVINLGFFPCIIPVIGWIWAIYMLVVWVMGLVYAINGEEKEVPLIGKIKLFS